MLGKKRRRPRRRRKSPEETLVNAQTKLKEWETKRRLADTKTRYWWRHVEAYQKRVITEKREVERKLARLETKKYEHKYTSCSKCLRKEG